MKKEFQYYYPYIDQNKIFITGTQHYEIHFKNSLLVSKKVFFNQNKLDFSKKYICFSGDDVNYCKFHYSFLKNAIFLENIPPMEQIVLKINCDGYIISNSTFSW